MYILAESIQIARNFSLFIAASTALLTTTAATTDTTAHFPPIAPLPVLIEFARSSSIEMGHFSSTQERPAAVGDRATLLVELQRGKKRQQWLIDFRVDELTASEKAETPPPDLVMNLNGPTGPTEIRFSNQRRLALEVLVSGPATASTPLDALSKTSSRVLMSPELLGLGLDDSCRIMQRFQPQPGMSQPAAPPVLTPDEQRDSMKFFPALMTFFQTLQSTPGLRDVLWAVLEKPSVWSMVKHGGRVDMSISVGKGIARAPAAEWSDITAAETYLMPLDVQLNEQPALLADLFVTSPKPPLLASAGMIGVRAKSPKRANQFVLIRMVACATASTGQ